MADVAVPLRPDRRPPAGAPSPRAGACSRTGVRGLKKSVSTIDSDRARPSSGGTVNHVDPQIPPLRKTFNQSRDT
eukprot:6214722-Pleurochrysis_carterae.AAC.3